MAALNLGDHLNRIADGARAALFVQGEMAQLTYLALGYAAKNVREDQKDELEIAYPIGYKADKTVMPFVRKYTKQELLDRYDFLSYTQLGVNGVMQLVTIIEAMLGDVLRAVVVKYPQKIGAKRTVTIQAVLEASSLEEMHLRATDSLINDLSYKSPTEFAEAFDGLIGINLLACPAFHCYLEIKATRDIHIHNRGIANETYIRKSGSHSRVKPGCHLPINNQYFLESYESCLQLTDWMEQELHQHWHSAELEARKQPQLELPAPVADANAT
ncbi:hypothetical protein QAA18_08450 [Luteimonas sp. 8-5]|uniref:hypothetical protein n=1 Tax=Luteimonas sp. 8-5 TaxID=3039387 RepID=UPI0024369570|nr:hypothetical protein [Luteimonas sp. 8-5]MDG6348763.1 hypothetical protein [Luteimonas sp. 8-5]